MQREKTIMKRRQIIYMFIPLMIVVAYTLLISVINRPQPAEAQTCFLIRFASCSGATCLPICPSAGLLSTDIANTGFTSALYGVEVMTGICFID